MMHHTPLADDEVAACPNCDVAALATGSRDDPASPHRSDTRYRCKNCGASIDALCVRERKPQGGRQYGLARKLLEADADEVGR